MSGEALEQAVQQKLQMPHLWKHSKKGWMFFWQPGLVKDDPAHDRGLN